MGWKSTGIFNDKYSLEKNMGEGYYIFEYDEPDDVSAKEVKFISPDYSEAKRIYELIAESRKPLKDIEIKVSTTLIFK